MSVMYRLVAVVVLISLVLAVFNHMGIAKPVKTLIRGEVRDSKGSPVSNALIVVWSEQRIAIIGHTVTSENGSFTLEVELDPRCSLYIFPLNDKWTEVVYTPLYMTLPGTKEIREIKVNAIVRPVAYINVTGEVVYIGGSWEPNFVLELLGEIKGKRKPLSEIIPCGNTTIEFSNRTIIESPLKLIDTYGTRDHPIVYRRIYREGITPVNIIGMRKAIVPAGTSILVKVRTTVYDKRPEVSPPVRTFEFTVRPERPLKRGEVFILDLTNESLSRFGMIEVLKNDIRLARREIAKAELLGLYLADERSMLRKAEALIELAEENMGKMDPQEIRSLLERAYVIARITITKRIEFMKAVALEGASFLPYFLSLFAVAIGYYLHEENKRKFMTFTLVFILFNAIFIMAYPGFMLMYTHRRDLFFINLALSYLIVAFLIFYLPRRIREAELPTLMRRGSLIAITFSIAKRYSRLKKTRTLITVFSLTALIWAFTVLASISTVYGMVEEGFTPNIKTEGILIRHMNATTNEYRPLDYYSDYRRLLRMEHVQLVVPRVYNNPKSSITIKLVYNDRPPIVLKSILGLSPEEDTFTGISRILIEGNWESIRDRTTILLPSTIARKLGIKKGDTVKLRFTMIEEEEYELKVRGIFSERELDKIVDLDGASVKPQVRTRKGYLPANSTDIIICNWEFLLKEVFVEEGELSKYFHIYTLYLRGDSDKLRDIAKTFIEIKGEGYYAYITTGNINVKMYYGYRVENILQENISFVIPIAIVGINVVVTMFSIVHERRRDIFIFNAIGFNPLQIAMLFLAESVVYGLLGGGIGYIAGIATFRVLSSTAEWHNLAVRAKLEWYWSIIMIAIAVIVSMIASFKPAARAAMMYTPSKVVRHKVEKEEERVKREEKIMVTYTGKSYGLGKIIADEAPIFFSYLYTRLSDLRSGLTERIEHLEELEEEEMADGTLIKRFKFRYVFRTDGELLETENEIVCSKRPKDKHYRIELNTSPSVTREIPMQYLDRVAETVLDIIKSWERDRKLLLSSTR